MSCGLSVQTGKHAFCAKETQVSGDVPALVFFDYYVTICA